MDVLQDRGTSNEMRITMSLDDSKAQQETKIVYSTDRLYRAVKTDEQAGFFEQDNLVWQAQYFDANRWQRGAYYETADQAIEGARRGKQTADLFNSLFD